MTNQINAEMIAAAALLSASESVSKAPHNRRATDVTAALWAQVTERSRESAVHSLVLTLLEPHALKLVR